MTQGLKTSVMLDSNCYDRWQATTLSEQERHKLSQRVNFVWTAVQADECSKASKNNFDSSLGKKALMPGIAGNKYAVSGNICCVSDESFQRMRIIVGNGKSENHSRDAFIAEAAKRHGCILVTEDLRLSRRAKTIGLEALNFDAFIERFAR